MVFGTAIEVVWVQWDGVLEVGEPNEIRAAIAAVFRGMIIEIGVILLFYWGRNGAQKGWERKPKD